MSLGSIFDFAPVVIFIEPACGRLDLVITFGSFVYERVLVRERVRAYVQSCACQSHLQVKLHCPVWILCFTSKDSKMICYTYSCDQEWRMLCVNDRCRRLKFKVTLEFKSWTFNQDRYDKRSSSLIFKILHDKNNITHPLWVTVTLNINFTLVIKLKCFDKETSNFIWRFFLTRLKSLKWSRSPRPLTKTLCFSNSSVLSFINHQTAAKRARHSAHG